MLTRIFGIAAAVILSGCSIHPVPEDVTGVDTPTIVRQIRCETRETLRLRITDWLTKLANNGNPVARDLVARFERDPEAISTFHYDSFRSYPRIRAVIKLFYDTGIAYSFDMTMTEDNDIGGSIDLLKPFTAGKLTLNIGGNAKRKRSNQRTFTVTDTFSYLLTKLNTEVRPGARYCNGHLVAENYKYPIAGRIGIDNVVTDFIELTLFANLAEQEAKPGARGAPTMADKLTFTTALDASITPTLVFTPVTTALHVSGATLTGTVARADVHSVIVAVAIDPASMVEIGPTRSYLFSDRNGAGAQAAGRGTPANTVIVGDRVIGRGTRAEALAVIAIDQVKRRELQIVPAP